MTALDVLSMLYATYIYVLCQAVDLRALHADFERTIPPTLAALLSSHFGADGAPLADAILAEMQAALEGNSTQDAADRMTSAARAAALPLYEALPARAAAVPSFVAALSGALLESYARVRAEYLEGARGAAPFLGRTRALYEFVRSALGVRMHGLANLRGFAGEGLDAFGERSVGESVSVIYEAIRDGRMQRALVGLFAA